MDWMVRDWDDDKLKNRVFELTESVKPDSIMHPTNESINGNNFVALVTSLKPKK
jgi:hypothetical protein